MAGGKKGSSSKSKGKRSDSQNVDLDMEAGPSNESKQTGTPSKKANKRRSLGKQGKEKHAKRSKNSKTPELGDENEVEQLNNDDYVEITNEEVIAATFEEDNEQVEMEVTVPLDDENLNPASSELDRNDADSESEDSNSEDSEDEETSRNNNASVLEDDRKETKSKRNPNMRKYTPPKKSSMDPEDKKEIIDSTFALFKNFMEETGLLKRKEDEESSQEKSEDESEKGK